jgi:hypothetical protein
MTNDFQLRDEVAELLLRFADEQHELTTSDFQARADVVARKIIKAVRARAGQEADDLGGPKHGEE